MWLISDEKVIWVEDEREIVSKQEHRGVKRLP